MAMGLPSDDDPLGIQKRGAAPRRQSSWHRQAPWMITLVAAVVLGVLIIGSLGVRQIIIVRRGADSDRPSVEESGRTQSGAAPGTNDSGHGASSAGSNPALLASSEPNFEVLSPRVAARRPARELPKMLLVGDHSAMFQTLESAMRFARSGDIIEIRTSQPIVVGAAELRVPDGAGDRQLTIRAGNGFQPVIRAAVANRAMITLEGLDVTVAGIHFTSRLPMTFLHSENGSVSFTDCSFTMVPPGGKGLAVSIQNSRGAQSPLLVAFHRCLLRRAGPLRCAGPSIALQIDNSALVYALTSVMGHDEGHSVSVSETTVVNSYLININKNASKDRKPTPLSFHMDRSIFGILACCPLLFDIVLPREMIPNDQEEIGNVIASAIGEFKAGNNFAQFWGFWAHVRAGSVARNVSEAVFQEFPKLDDTIRFGPRIEEVRRLIHQKGNPPETALLIASVQPADLVFTSTGGLGQQTRAGIRIGCDVRELPAPPLTTLREYKLDRLVIAEAEDLRVVRTSGGLAVDRSGMPGFFGYRHTHMVGRATKPGQWAEFAVPVNRAGRYDVQLRLMGGPRHGKIKVSLNGRPLVASMDTHADALSPLPVVNLGEVLLSAGNAVLRVETMEQSPAARQPGFVFAVDCLMLQRM